MENVLLAVGVIVATLLWRRFGFWLPARVPVALSTRARLVFAAGCLTAVLAVVYSSGDVIIGRTEVSGTAPRYATRLRPPEAHLHDIPDAGRFWRQIARQLAMGLLVGGVLIGSSREAARLGRL